MMKRLLLYLSLVAFALGSGCMARGVLQVKTDPPGGTVQIEGTETQAPDGGTLELSPGTYKLRSSKDGYRGGAQEVTVKAKDQQEVTVPLGQGFATVRIESDPAGGKIWIDEEYTGRTTPAEMEISAGKHEVKIGSQGFLDHVALLDVAPNQPGLVEATLEQKKSRIHVTTEPPGGELTVEGFGEKRKLQVGEVFYLKKGTYRLMARKKGYPGGRDTIEVDGTTPVSRTISLGAGFGTVMVSTVPDGADVIVDGIAKGRSPREELRLGVGPHKLLVRKGLGEMEKAFDISAGEEKGIHIKIPRSATIAVTTEPAGGKVWLDGNEAGTSPVRHSLVFGVHQVNGVRVLSGTERLSGRKSFTHASRGSKKIRLRLDSRERLFEGAWLGKNSALEKENARYQRQRVSTCIGVRMDLDNGTMAALAGRNDLTETLQAVLRVGDRIALSHKGRTWTLWRRHRHPTPEDRMAAAALTAGREYRPPWKEDAPAKWVVTKANGGNPLTAIAFALHRSRTPFPLLDMARTQLDPNGEVVERVASDGDLTLMVNGGKGVRTEDRDLEAYRIAGLICLPLGAADSPLKFSWQQAPKRLMVIADGETPLLAPPNNITLRSREKRLVSLAQNIKVTELIRLTRGPAIDGWKREVLRADMPMADRIDLTRDEIGPHQTFGDYQRHWILRYNQEGGRSQRHSAGSYRVSNEEVDPRGNSFLRHGAGIVSRQ